MKKFTFFFIFIFVIINYNIYSQNFESISEVKPFSIQGSLGLNLNSYSSSGIESRFRPFDYNILGSVNLSIYGISLPFSAVFSEQDRNYTQPFNQYGISPQYKWVTAHLGWRNISFSPYTLAGHIFLGGGLELNPGIFRFGVVYGRFVKSTTGDSSNLGFYPSTYQRNGYSLKLGLGSSTSYVDLIMLRAWDDTNSLSQKYRESVKPSENLVLGISSKLAIIKGLRFEFDAAASLYTLDLRSDDLVDSFRINALTQFNSFFKLRLSTQLTTALQSSLVYSGNLFTAKLNYKRIEPDYKSMGMYYSESDVENYTISLSVPLFQRLVRVGGSIGFQKDNLMNTKSATSNRVIGSANFSYNQAQFGVDLNYSSYGITQTRGINPIIDSLKISKVNQNFNFTTRYTFSSNESLSNLILNTSYQALNDLNPSTAPNSESQNYNLNITYQQSNPNTGINYGITINAIQSNFANNTTAFIGPIIQFSSPLFGIAFSSSLGYQNSFYNSQNNGGVTTASISSAYTFENHHNIKFDANLLISNSKTTNRFNELRLALGYIYNF
jgi:hypothetical protein